METPNTSSQRRNHIIVATACGVFVAAMVGAAYAAVPLYNWFCRTTGFGGTTQVATAAPSHVAGGLPWRFESEQNSIEVRIGEVVTVSYSVVNESARETVGVASYNVSPPTAGIYFSKINCFCFTDQRLKGGEKRDMTVVFFVDPELVKDWEQDGLDTITLSYTMYPTRQPEAPRVGSGAALAPGRS